VRSASRLEEHVWHRIQGWAAAEHPDEYRAGLELFTGGSSELDGDESLVLCSWLHLDYRPRGHASFTEMYAALPGLAADERAIASRMAQAQLGLHRVLGSRPGEWIDLESVTRGVRVRVRVQSEQVSRAAVRWDVLLGRVIEGETGASLWGPAAFYRPDEEAELAEELARLARQLGVPADADGFDLVFRHAALELVRFIPASRSIEPIPYSAEGHPAAHAEAVWAVAGDPVDALDGLDAPPELTWMGADPECDSFVWALPAAELIRARGSLPRGALVLSCTPVMLGGEAPPWLDDRVAVGTFELAGAELTFTALSAERLDAAVALVKERLGRRARLVRREVTPLADQLAMRRAEARATRPKLPPPSVPEPEARDAVVAMQDRHYRQMLDEPHPRLGGLSPRQAAGDPAQREELCALVRGIENHVERERRDGEPVPDVAWLRAELGLDEALAA
jgi:hypothetical protein